MPRPRPAPRRRLATGLVALLAATASAGAAVAAVELLAPEAGIELRPIGRYDGGVYSPSAVQNPPAYDRAGRRLFVASQARLRVDVLDLRDPAAPALAGTIGIADLPFDVDPFRIGGFASLAFKDGVLAVALFGRTKVQLGQLLLFDADGRTLGPVADLGFSPNAMAFLPGRRLRLLVVNQGDNDDGDGGNPPASLALITLRDAGGGGLEPRVARLGFEAFDAGADGLRARGVRLPLPGAPPSRQLEPESLAIDAGGRRAWVTLPRNNAIAAVDLEAGRVTDLLPLGSRDLGVSGQGLDASDADGRARVRTWPGRALFAPDGIAAYRSRAGRPVLVTANEGDPRPGEEVRVGEAGLDRRRFANVPYLLRPENLGRLLVTRVEGDPDGDGALEAVVALGARSIATWGAAAGEPLWDSGDVIERATARAAPGAFNATDDEALFDARSDDRGPEPEAVAVGEVAGRTYAFATLERIGGVVAYDVTDPRAGRFQTYVNTRDLAVDPTAACDANAPKPPECAAAGDLGPESLVFVPAADAPDGRALLLVRFDLSDTLVAFEVRPR